MREAKFRSGIDVTLEARVWFELRVDNCFPGAGFHMGASWAVARFTRNVPFFAAVIQLGQMGVGGVVKPASDVRVAFGATLGSNDGSSGDLG